MTDDNLQPSLSESTAQRQAFEDAPQLIIVKPTASPPSVSIRTPTSNASGSGSPTGIPPFRVIGQLYTLSDADDSINLSFRPEALGKQVLGLAGNDVIFGSSLADFINGQQGADVINGGSGDDILFGGVGSDRLDGGSGNDSILGGNDNDTLIGSDGNDNILGGRGSDILYGDSGNDFLSGDRDQDILNGGTGNDTFFLSSAAGTPLLAQADLITDFRIGEDKIAIDRNTPGNVSFDPVNVTLDSVGPVSSTAIRAGNTYLGIVLGLSPELLSSSDLIRI